MFSDLHLNANQALIALGNRHGGLPDMFMQFSREIVRRQCLSRTENHGSFESVFQLSNIPRILISLQHGTSFRVQFRDRFAEFQRKAHDCFPAEGYNIFESLTKRGDLKCDDVETEIEIFSEGSSLHLLLDFSVRRRDKAEIRPEIVGAPEPP